MASCPHCSLDVSPNAQTCPKCGHSFVKDKLAESAEKVIVGVAATIWSGYLFLFHAALVFGILFGLGKIAELENNPFGGAVDSGEQAAMWFFFLVLPCSLLLIYQIYQAIKDWRKK